MKKKKFSLNIALFILLMMLAVIQVFVLNTSSTVGKELTRITEEIEDIENENTRLSQKMASASSIMTISTKAQMLGFIQHPSVASLTSPQPLAYSPETSF